MAWRSQGSNPRPPALRAKALPLSHRCVFLRFCCWLILQMCLYVPELTGWKAIYFYRQCNIICAFKHYFYQGNCSHNYFKNNYNIFAFSPGKQGWGYHGDTFSKKKKKNKFFFVVSVTQHVFLQTVNFSKKLMLPFCLYIASPGFYLTPLVCAILHYINAFLLCAY